MRQLRLVESSPPMTLHAFVLEALRDLPFRQRAREERRRRRRQKKARGVCRVDQAEQQLLPSFQVVKQRAAEYIGADES